ncbi:hypothetical protein Ctob_000909 [Chrysochromulina tobinii]|uniref:Uncharacterized protein n=1 Tax=Chrysochromulina tobinii TaxID=1460289 RepID=A0A0M0J673_9EUKA|nr:hypothetical protein Ctob_000909 [Chrysochromulina tobinii]|eukprot:KOO21728.1 hypothetical protein Ctob_000909 [Chrysochromulina sp. CCMP291]
MSSSTSRSVISSRCVGAGCPRPRHRREQRTRRDSARQNRFTPLSSHSVTTSTIPRAASLASSEGCRMGATGAVALAAPSCCSAS